MKIKFMFLVLAVAISLPAIAQQKKNKKQEAGPVQVTDSVSYAFGSQIAESLKSGNIINSLNLEQFMLAFTDVKQGAVKLTAEQSKNVITAFLETQFIRMKEENLKKANDFLADNKTKDSIVTLPSGLQYKVLKEGTGNNPKPTDEVEVHYIGTLLDGRKFDSSYDRNQTAKFILNRVINGWTEGLQHIKEGGKIKLFVPPDMGYGENGMPNTIIEPNSVLVFEIELIKANAAAAQQAPQGGGITVSPRSIVPNN